MLRILSNLLPDIVIEVIARGVGYVVRQARPTMAMQAEGRVRGILLSPRFSASQLWIGRGVVLQGGTNIVFGENIRIHAGSQLVAGKTGRIELGDHSHISRNSILAGGGDILIGAHCSISSGVSIYTSTYDRPEGVRLRDSAITKAAIRIGDDVHIGANSTILPGVEIGSNAIIGAGAVVTKNVEAGVTAIGVPARPA